MGTSQRLAATISRWRRFELGSGSPAASIDNYWRVIDVDGGVPEEFTGDGLGPRTADEARDWLRREGVRLDALGRADARQRFYPWNWVDDSEPAKAATISMIERHAA
jgi:hypothetical protein